MSDALVLLTDVDGCWVQHLPAFVRLVEAGFGIRLSEEDIVSYSLQIPGVNPIEMEELYHNAAASATVDPTFVECLPRLQRLATVISVTRRPPTHWDGLGRQIALVPHMLITHQPPVSRLDVLRLIRPDIYIDDHPDTIVEVVREGLAEVVVFDAPYNRDLPGCYHRVVNWHEVLDLVAKTTGSSLERRLK